MSFADKEAGRAYKKEWAARNKEKRRESSRRFRASHPPGYRKEDVEKRRRQVRWYYRAKIRGWAPGEPEKAEQARTSVVCCRLCQSADPGKKGWMADHCHEAGYWRGFICRHCNVRLTRAALLDKGLLSPKEIAYLKTSECPHCRETYE